MPHVEITDEALGRSIRRDPIGERDELETLAVHELIDQDLRGAGWVERQGDEFPVGPVFPGSVRLAGRPDVPEVLDLLECQHPLGCVDGGSPLGVEHVLLFGRELVAV